MDLFSCIVLLVFGLIVFVGRLLMVKFDCMSGLDLRHPMKNGLAALVLNIALLLLAVAPFVAGVVCLIKLLA